MHHTVALHSLNEVDFVNLRDSCKFSKLNPEVAIYSFGENIYVGQNPSNDRAVLFEYQDQQLPVVSFIILGKTVYLHTAGSVSKQTIETLIRGNITKFCLQEQGHFCLHAAAIAVGNKVILLIGKKGAGKSTLATYFHINGHQVWCDDYARLERKDNFFFAYQGDTSLKINKDIVAAFNILPSDLKTTFEFPLNWIEEKGIDAIPQKYFFNQKPTPHDKNPRQVVAVFFLKGRTTDPQEIIATADRKEAMSVLMEEILLPGVNSKEYLKTYFQSSMELLKNTPIYTVEGPENIGRIGEIYDDILHSLNNV